MMNDAIKNFPKQFEYEPKVENSDKLDKFSKFVVVGMGGSGHAADLLKVWRPNLELIVHRNYGLPSLSEEYLRDSLIIASSYSGNTEEVLHAFNEAVEKKLAVLAISIGGKLIELAKEHSVSYIELPDTDIQPRAATGFSFRALLKAIGDEDALGEVKLLADSLDSSEYEDAGRDLAKKLEGSVPIIYSSRRNLAIANNWKIKFNETGKIPAFYNVFPELNHNEMTGFDIKEQTRPLSKRFHFIFLRDEADDPRIIKRMDITKQLYEGRGLGVELLELNSNSSFSKIFSSLLLADWTAYHTAMSYGVDPEQVPMVEEFKKLI